MEKFGELSIRTEYKNGLLEVWGAASPMVQERVGTPVGARIDAVIGQLIVRMAKDNPGWGYDPSVGGWPTSGMRCQTRWWAAPWVLLSPERRKTTTWAQFIRFRLAVLEIARITAHPNERWMHEMPWP
jgi:hypothetical protein